MSSPVKKDRRYVSARRAEQARQTRREIVAAAHRLLVDRGYPGTTIEAIAEEAGVAIQTIYSAVGNKRAVLWAVLDTAVAGDDAPRTLLERFREELDGVVEPRERLRRAVGFGRRIMERSADVHRIMRSAAGSDPEVAAALAEAEHRRYRDSGDIVRLIAGTDGFGPSMDAETAADLWFALTGYETHQVLIGDRGWSPQRYEHWMARTLEVILA
jgi:AcrR family transcriptional regulator